MLKSHIAKIERIRGGFNIDMLEFELVHGDIAKDRPQFAFRFQMRLSDAESLADAIYRQLCRRPPKKRKKKKEEQQPLTPIFPNIEVAKNQMLPGSPQPNTGVPPAPPAGPLPPPTVPQSGPVAGIPISPPAANAGPAPVSRPGMPPKGVGPEPVIGGRRYMEGLIYGRKENETDKRPVERPMTGEFFNYRGGNHVKNIS